MEMSNLKKMGGSEDETDLGEVKTESLVNQRMTIAGGFLDVALFVANVEHLKFIIDTGKEDIEYYNLLLTLLFSSLSLQILVGILLFVVGFGKSMQTLDEKKWTKVLDHTIIGLVSLIAIIDIFITTFGDRGETIVLFRNTHNCQLRTDIRGLGNTTNSILFA